MNKRERVLAAIQGREVDGIPSSFSLHFPESVAYGDAAVQAHLDFYRDTEVDILKIMNENLVPYMGEINQASDYQMVRASMDDKFMTDQLRLIGKILERTDSDTFTMGTVHGIVASAIHPLEKMKQKFNYDEVRAHLAKLIAEDFVPVIDGLKRLADLLCEFVQASIREGIDAIYYAALGGEHRFFTDEQFARWIEPLDLMVMDAAREAGGYCVLHICKDAVNMERYRNYGPHCDVVNWGVFEAPYSLEEGRKLFPQATIMGGLEHRSGVLVSGTEEEVRASVQKVIKSFGREKFILGADCTLDTYQDLTLVRAAARAAREN